MPDTEQRERFFRLLHGIALALLIGIPAAGLAWLYEEAVHETQVFLFEGLPDDLGLDGLPGWWVVLVTTVGAALCAVALRLPGHGGHEPLEGLSLSGDPPRLLGVLLAAFATLAFGAVLGPEMPLLALGQWLGMKAARRAHDDVKTLAGLAGAGAVLAMVFGNPLASGVVLLEGARKVPAAVLIAPFLGGTVGFAIFTGFGPFDGLPAPSLASAGLPTYESLRLVDLLLAIPVALAAAGIVMACRRIGHGVLDARNRIGVAPVLIGSGLAIGLIAVAFRAIADEPIDLVLFSGMEAVSETATIGTASVALGILLAKGLAYAICLGAGFKGGPIFPALVLGVALGAAVAELPGDFSLTAAVAAGAAAACATQMRLPISATLLAVIVVGSAGLAAISVAALAAAVGFLVRLVADGGDGEGEGEGDGKDQPTRHAPAPAHA